ncbi:selenocysteine-specific translation elongation factor [Intestinibacter bartlettii]|uniref:selenocysteine-specific translation elongation factor n=1 Tax=Intestinibacter bartlettii TaxID=261299 RepID=UPI0006648EA3|nr:selenocysteine-specific translation elongation factor [Intestinibacter bartlettii]KMW24369.1 selenocysteine-specific translation elongation factor [Clostridium sp. 1_1_41A1FAA]MDU1253664.1 selenocysteine-specific translation elongation factor [Peptostreptococcaceae bacterium]MDU5919148.1 selenocysteine-specific translation elongation factor [Clostridiales bacterium]MCB5745397.1 selenocysteine-specific translation elongation factor [Intestinibacter bartlettii]MDU2694407.1 selenocysteine-spec
MKNVILGTAGHIDHGKTTLIKALTGRETDNLKEEKQRGISINLGFTYFDLPSKKRVGIVDVPGHEKFIKNMLAGACGIDIVLLVIAADEGVMPQTIEHLDILNYLDVKKGIIVLTKCDLVDEEFIELVKDDVREKTKGLFIEGAPIVEVNSVSRRGLDELVQKIDEISEDIEEKKTDAPSRMSIDRVFSLKGFGTIVTGTLIEGKISVDDEMTIYPSEKKVKVRNLQVHGCDVKTAYAGQRTAINLSNIKVSEIQRGDVIAQTGSVEESMMIDVNISLVEHCKKSLKHWDRIRIFHGTKQILCRIVPLNEDEIQYGESGYAQLRLEEKIVAKKGDRFIIRSYSPMDTIGGGVIIDTAPKKHKIYDESVIEALKIKEKGELKDILEEYLKLNLSNYITLKELVSYTGEKEEYVKEGLNALIDENKVFCINKYYLHISHYQKLKERVIDILTKYHKQYRLRNGILKEELRSKVDNSLKVKDMDVILNKMVEEKDIKVQDNLVSNYDFEVEFNQKQLSIKKEIEDKSRKNGLNSLMTKDDICNKNKFYEEVLEALTGETIQKLDDAYYIDKKVYENVKKDLLEYLNKNKEITVAQFRDITKSNRKISIVMLEHFDRNRITKRVEDKRILY